MSRETSGWLYACVNEYGAVYWTRGGSSTPAKLMVYDSFAAANRALRWAPEFAVVRRVYTASKPQ